MKGILKVIILGSMFGLSNYVMAADTTVTTTKKTTVNASMWICTTNASSATSGSPDEQADQKMANTAAAGTSAFDFAMKHCRDCTKITCELQTKPAE
ncbi:hypothetical protein [Legionella sp. PC997]|uniref:hypothetical protein n=1 Tax=Legionella sp. PC997 TaxID=2755562 RepID=UPI0015FC25F8|nr:hypothetical protein [Legionella sp. PC997]QMT60551.1 hypothetical protein HBNCFIEN_01924 [Legionella sp. PC997]